MRIEIASERAVKFACKKFHYTRKKPSVSVAFSVFNSKNEWCGVICYSAGANNNIAKSFGLVQGQVIELVRVALNGMQDQTSKALALTMKKVKKILPNTKIIVSYADPEQGHIGILYQATNWTYLGTSKAQREVIHPETGMILHKRSANAMFGTIKGLQKSDIFFKHKYAYPICKEMSIFCDKHKKQYPKHALQALTDDADGIPAAEGVRYDRSAQNNVGITW